MSYIKELITQSFALIFLLIYQQIYKDKSKYITDNITSIRIHWISQISRETLVSNKWNFFHWIPHPRKPLYAKHGRGMRGPYYCRIAVFGFIETKKWESSTLRQVQKISFNLTAFIQVTSLEIEIENCWFIFYVLKKKILMKKY
jgi:hypothetical protein